ncbi:hypothetical protein SmJEL517_g06042 [Synchytrium microbalum]|uniref:D-lactate dehydrogenase (cytochrome) n=1 Tax=Synchytrium microbalum TaxID=1806994 RepID=A0A507BRP0_9FUNG|nr:uncharacterized protein SmJEL517_g06042 [Synchytrium microbalum]TPX30392.1 hypothetical protein SmJEL517_g06042 [Synchytrium microbalum]
MSKAVFTSIVLASSRRFAHTKASRNPLYRILSDEDVKIFKSILPSPGSVLTSDLDSYNTDWIKKYRGHSKVVLRPSSTQEVSKILSYCNKQNIAVVPQGGNTGLVGGSVPVFDEVVLSLGRMDKIKSFDDISGIVVCEAGTILEKLDLYLHDRGYTVPLDLGAKGTCQIGGNVSTNAGGVRLLRMGSLRGNVLGLEVVLPDGTIIDSLSTLRKDNTGYDIKQLFIGAEGTLGIVTAVSLLTPKKSSAVNVAVLGCDSFESVLKAFTQAKTDLQEILSAFEFWDDQAMQMMNSKLPEVRNPLSHSFPFYVLIETSGSNATHDSEKLASYLENVISDAVVSDGVLAQDGTQMRSFWNLREGIPLAGSKHPAQYKYDMSIPINVYYGLVEAVRTHLQQNHKAVYDKYITSVAGYGHIGDGNCHINVTSEEYNDEVQNCLEPFIYEWVAKHRGSISAEHGLGYMKTDCIGYSKSPEAIRVMQDLKALFDPNGILNPYKAIQLRK